MSDILKRIIYFVYGWDLETVILWTFIFIILWTVINKRITRKTSRRINWVMLSLIIVAVVFFTITARSTKTERQIHLIPFWSYIASHGSGRETLWLNAFFFLPIGLSLPFLLPDKVKNKPRTTIIIACGFSLAIEMIQFIFKLGLCETTDVIMNTLGAALGTISYIAANHKKEKSEP